MKPVQVLVLRVAALVVGSAIIGASIATNPATAPDVNSMLGAIGLTTCSQSTPCKKYKNNGSGAGLEGIGANGNGLIAQSINGSATFSTSTNADGVQAYSSNNDGTNSGTNNDSSINPGRSGVWGHDDSTDGGYANVGVAGSSTNGTGVYAASSNYIGLNAVGGGYVNGVHVPALSVVGAQYSLNLITVCGDLSDNPCTDGSGSMVLNMDHNGDLRISGELYTNGSCSLGCAVGKNGFSHKIASYAPTQTVPSIDDFGEAQLVNGHAYVPLSADFANVIDKHANYLVFLTPEGDCNGLFYTSKSGAGFDVRELRGGHSSIAFDFRIVAKPYGVNKPRLPMQTIVPRPARATLRTH